MYQVCAPTTTFSPPHLRAQVELLLVGQPSHRRALRRRLAVDGSRAGDGVAVCAVGQRLARRRGRVGRRGRCARRRAGCGRGRGRRRCARGRRGRLGWRRAGRGDLRRGGRGDHEVRRPGGRAGLTICSAAAGGEQKRKKEDRNQPDRSRRAGSAPPTHARSPPRPGVRPFTSHEKSTGRPCPPQRWSNINASMARVRQGPAARARRRAGSDLSLLGRRRYAAVQTVKSGR